MIHNLREDQLYSLLPDALITLDERKLIQSVIGGFQDRLSDLRAYSAKIAFFYDPTVFPETTVNAVLADVTTDSGVVVTRSLEIQDDTPLASNVAGLNAWVAQQLNLPTAQFTNVRYGVDLLRQVDANTLGYLADTIGAILYASPLSTNNTLTQQQLVQTYFPRLKIKGTVRSFEVLGRILGFDDVKVTPLWARVSPREPQDIGNAANAPDFSQHSEFPPQQYFGVDYNPLATRDGPFFHWQGTVSNRATDTQFYEKVINGFSPFLAVSTVATQGGTVTHPSSGSYALAGGDAYTKARVTPAGSGVQFVALVQGESYNGLEVSVSFSGTGSLAVVSVLDQLSTVKYRSAFYDLALAADMDKVEEVFGASAVRKNADLAAGSNTPDGIALSPFRPWIAGSIATAQVKRDYLTVTEVSNGTTVVTARYQALPTDRELNIDQLVAAGVTVAQAFEEVRPATRFPRRTSTGFLIDDKVPYAFYGTQALLFVSGGSSVYSGFDSYRPVPDYEARIVVVNGTGTYEAVASIDPDDSALWHYQAILPGITFTGSYQFTAGTYRWNISPGTAGQQVWAFYTVTSTGTVRPEPSFVTKDADAIVALERPEDDWYGTHTDLETIDEYPWRRDAVNGGELVEVDAYLPSVPDIGVTPVSAECVFQDQTSAEYSMRVVLSATSGTHMRYVSEARSTKPYVPGMLPIGYKGTFKNLASLTVQEVSDLNTLTDAETLFQPGYALYHTGLAQGVLVADLPKFFGQHHRKALVGWLPFNEHPEEPLRVLDHSPVNGAQYIEGIFPHDRVWDGNRGWYLTFEPGGMLSSDDIRNWGAEQTASFWFSGSSGTGPQTILKSGGLSFDYSSGTMSGYALSNGVRVLVGRALMNDWQFVYLRRNATQAVFGNGSLGGSAAETTVNAGFDADIDGDQITIQSGTLCFGLHDLRVWSVQKTQTDMDLVRCPAPTPTVVNYPIGFMMSANAQDRYGLRVLANGWVTTDVMPAWVRRPAMAWIRRYDDMGLYEGESRFKETGLGDGAPLPALYQLGDQYRAMTATGTAVYATGTGQVPGVNDLWLTDTNAGVYAAIFGGTGTATHLNTTSAPWPQDMVQTNPNRDFVWIKGDNGLVYEITVDGTLGITQLKADIVARHRAQSEIQVNPVYNTLLTTGTYWEVTGTATISGVLSGNTGIFTITSLP